MICGQMVETLMGGVPSTRDAKHATWSACFNLVRLPSSSIIYFGFCSQLARSKMTGEPTTRSLSPPLESQTYYIEPFSRLKNAWIVLCILLGICAIIEISVGGHDASLVGAITGFILSIVALVGILFFTVTSPSVGLISRQPTCWTIRPFFGRSKCERTGGVFRERILARGFPYHTFDYNEPYISHSAFGKTFNLRWDRALIVVGW